MNPEVPKDANLPALERKLILTPIQKELPFEEMSLNHFSQFYADHCTINLASSQFLVTPLIKQLLFNGVCRLVQLHGITIANHLTANSQAALKAAASKSGKRFIGCLDTESEFVGASLDPLNFRIMPVTLNALHPKINFLYLHIKSEKDFPPEKTLQAIIKRNIWLHLDIRETDPDKLIAQSEKGAFRNLVNSPAVKSIAVNFAPITGFYDTAVDVYPGDKENYSIPIMNRRVWFPAGDNGFRKADKYFWENRDTLDTTIASAPPFLNVYELFRKFGFANGFHRLFEFSYESSTGFHIKDQNTGEEWDEFSGNTRITYSDGSWFGTPFAIDNYIHTDLCNLRSSLEPPSNLEGLHLYMKKDINSADPEMQELRQRVFSFVGDALNLTQDRYAGFALESGSAANYKAWQAYSQWRIQNRMYYPHKPSLYVSGLAHRSFQLAAGRYCKAIYPSGDDFQMSESELKSKLKPGDMLVLTIGTTSLGHADFISTGLMDYCKANGIWVHIDLCYGFSFLLRNNDTDYVLRTNLYVQNLLSRGIVKSVSADMHKICGPYGSGICLLLDDAQELKSKFIPTEKSAFAFEAAKRALDERGIEFLKESLVSDYRFALVLWNKLRHIDGLRLMNPIRSGIIPLRMGNSAEANLFHTSLHNLGVSSALIRVHPNQDSAEIHGIKFVVNQWDTPVLELPEIIEEAYSDRRSSLNLILSHGTKFTERIIGAIGSIYRAYEADTYLGGEPIYKFKN